MQLKSSTRRSSTFPIIDDEQKHPRSIAPEDGIKPRDKRQRKEAHRRREQIPADRRDHLRHLDLQESGTAEIGQQKGVRFLVRPGGLHVQRLVRLLQRNHHNPGEEVQDTKQNNGLVDLFIFAFNFNGPTQKEYWYKRYKLKQDKQKGRNL